MLGRPGSFGQRQAIIELVLESAQYHIPEFLLLFSGRLCVCYSRSRRSCALFGSVIDAVLQTLR